MPAADSAGSEICDKICLLVKPSFELGDMKNNSAFSGRFRFGRAAFAIGTLSFMATLPGSLWAQTVPPIRQLLTVDLEESADRSRLRIVSGLPLEWQMSRTADGSPVLEFPNSDAGPRFRSQTFGQGLVSAIEIGQDGRGAVQATLLTIRTRREIELFISQSGEVLTVELVPEPSSSTVAELSSQSAQVGAGTADEEKGVRVALEESKRLLEIRIEQGEAVRLDLERRLAEATADLARAERDLANSPSEHERKLWQAEVDLAKLAAEFEGTRRVPQGPGSLFVVSSRAAPCLNLRTSANTGASVLACIDLGTRVTLLREESSWGRVRLPNGRVGWAALEYLEPVTPTPL